MNGDLLREFSNLEPLDRLRLERAKLLRSSLPFSFWGVVCSFLEVFVINRFEFLYRNNQLLFSMLDLNDDHYWLTYSDASKVGLRLAKISGKYTSSILDYSEQAYKAKLRKKHALNEARRLSFFLLPEQDPCPEFGYYQILVTVKHPHKIKNIDHFPYFVNARNLDAVKEINKLRPKINDVVKRFSSSIKIRGVYFPGYSLELSTETLFASYSTSSGVIKPAINLHLHGLLVISKVNIAKLEDSLTKLAIKNYGNGSRALIKPLNIDYVDPSNPGNRQLRTFDYDSSVVSKWVKYINKQPGMPYLLNNNKAKDGKPLGLKQIDLLEKLSFKDRCRSVNALANNLRFTRKRVKYGFINKLSEVATLRIKTRNKRDKPVLHLSQDMEHIIPVKSNKFYYEFDL